MATLHNLNNESKPSFLSGFGQKLRSVAEVIGTARGLYDMGRGIYTVGRTVAPIIGALL